MAIRTVMEDAALAQQMGVFAREQVIKKFSLEAFVQQLNGNIVASLMNSPARPSLWAWSIAFVCIALIVSSTFAIYKSCLF
jgi:hypothetical protein